MYFEKNDDFLRGLVGDTGVEEYVLCWSELPNLFRTCLALIKAMMVCMDKDPLVYTAAMEAEGINRKVSYEPYPFLSSYCFRIDR